MVKWNIYTPEGVQDIMFRECAIKRELERRAIEQFEMRGFLEIQPPTIEFYDVFSTHSGTIKQETMFKFFDHQGRILVLRPDFTTSVARISATKPIQLPKPWKFSYIGNVFRFDETGDGKLNQKEFTQAGIEILGASQPEADAEVIATIIDVIRLSGIEEFQIEIGQVEFFKGLMEEAKFSEEESEKVRSLIENKDYLGLENELNSKNLPEKLRETIMQIPEMFGSLEVIDNVYEKIGNQRSRDALNNLRSICDILEHYGVSSYISIDLGMVQSIDYYTGMIFRGLTYGVGSTICGGGRYDNLTSEFGESIPATGGAVGINRLMLALDRQSIQVELPQVDTLLDYCPSGRKTALQLAGSLRRQELAVELSLTPGDEEKNKNYALQKDLKGIISVKDEQHIELFDLVSGKRSSTSIDQLLRK